MNIKPSIYNCIRQKNQLQYHVLDIIVSEDVRHPALLVWHILVSFPISLPVLSVLQHPFIALDSA